MEPFKFHCVDCHKDFEDFFKIECPFCGSALVTSNPELISKCKCKTKKEALKLSGIKYTFEHSSGTIRIDILANGEEEAREALVHTVRRPELYSLETVDVNGMEE